ncbi:hypothetical protein HYR69_01925 [Candidatus Sumerlaeota bacterium]|nr:hypothetical protein [Candidatus Sumerlaeota bacterium]
MKSSTIFALLISGVVALLTINEFWRYWIARLTPDSLPYSRRRLARRLGVSLLLLFIAAMIYFKPAELTALTELIWLSLCLAAGIIILILAIRDLH